MYEYINPKDKHHLLPVSFQRFSSSLNTRNKSNLKENTTLISSLMLVISPLFHCWLIIQALKWEKDRQVDIFMSKDIGKKYVKRRKEGKWVVNLHKNSLCLRICTYTRKKGLPLTLLLFSFFNPYFSTPATLYEGVECLFCFLFLISHRCLASYSTKCALTVALDALSVESCTTKKITSKHNWVHIFFYVVSSLAIFSTQQPSFNRNYTVLHCSVN